MGWFSDWFGQGGDGWVDSDGDEHPGGSESYDFSSPDGSEADDDC